MARFSFRRGDHEPARLVITDPADAPAPGEATPDQNKSKLNLEPDQDTVGSASTISDSELDMRLKLHSKLIEEIDLSKLDKLDEAEMRRQVRRLVGDFARTERLALNGAELD